MGLTPWKMWIGLQPKSSNTTSKNLPVPEEDKRESLRHWMKREEMRELFRCGISPYLGAEPRGLNIFLKKDLVFQTQSKLLWEHLKIELSFSLETPLYIL